MTETKSDVTSNIATNTALDYTQKSLSHPRYRFSQILPQTTPPTVNGGQDILFQIPVRVVNMSESILRFTIKPPAAGPGAGTINVSHVTPLSMIRTIEFYNQGNQMLCQLYNVNKYLNTVFFAETKLEDFIDLPVTKDKVSRVAGVANLIANTVSDWGIGTFKCNTLFNNRLVDGSDETNLQAAHDNLTIAANINPNNNIYPQNGSGRYVIQTNAGVISEVNQYGGPNQRAYFRTGVINNNLSPTINVNFPLKYLYNTILSLNKDMYFGEIMYLRFVFDGADSTYYNTTPGVIGIIANNLTIDAPLVPNYSDALINAPAAIGNVNLPITNISLYVAIEEDLGISTVITNKFMTEGLRYNIPFVWTSKIAPGPQTNPNISLRWNTGMGKFIRKIYVAPFHNTESGATAYMRYNDLGNNAPGGNAQIITSFYTMLNNTRINDFNIDNTYQQDWMLMQRKLKGSALQGYKDYTGSWFWCEDFTGEGPLWDKESKDTTLRSGVSLSSEQKYDAYFYTSNIALLFYVFAIVEREVSCRPGQIIIT